MLNGIKAAVQVPAKKNLKKCLAAERQIYRFFSNGKYLLNNNTSPAFDGENLKTKGVQKQFRQSPEFAPPVGKGFYNSFSTEAPKELNNGGTILANLQVPLPDYPSMEDEIPMQEVAFHGLDNDVPCASKPNVSGPEPQYQKVVSGFEIYHHKERFYFKHRKGVLPELNIAYETWGELNEDKSNAIMLYTGLSASSHAKSHKKNGNPGWWEKFIGPGSALDTNKFFVICTNNLGGCYGSTYSWQSALDKITEKELQKGHGLHGPSSINPLSNKAYGTTFPIVTVQDMIRASFLLLDHLQINKLYASVGSSLGGMLSLSSAVQFPDRVQRMVTISATAQTHPSTIALRYLQRKAIMLDPNWHKGHYYDKKVFPVTGMTLAREIATITYRSVPEWEKRFGRSKIQYDTEPSLCPDFMIESYIEHQGESFCTKYDANSLLYISKAMDLFDLSEEWGGMNAALSRVQCPSMVIGVKTDSLIPVWQQRQMAQQLQEGGNDRVTYYELNSVYGHDTFLLDLNGVGAGLKGFLETEMKENGKATRV